MTVGQLKKLLEVMSDDVVLVVPAPDHSYREVLPMPTKADVYPDPVYNSQRHLAEHFGEENQVEGCNGSIDVLLFE